MFASSTGPRSAARRRGIVLVLVLGMLGLMALIGVTFATFAGQSLKNGRNFSQGVGRPQPEALMDYALAQLINDTNNPLSAIRGHSLLRDMYGNDSTFRGFNPPGNPVAETRGFLNSVYDSSIPGFSTLHFVGAPSYRSSVGGTATPFYNQLQYQTNIPTNGPYAGYDFTRWIVRFPGFIANGNNAGSAYSYVSQTFEILEDDFSGTYHKFTLSSNLVNPTIDPNFNSPPNSAPIPTSSDTQSFIYYDGNLAATSTQTANTPADDFATKPITTLTRELGGPLGGTYSSPSNPFVLDGRYMRAFNGPGVTRPSKPVSSGNYAFNPAYPFNRAAYANMRVIASDPAVQAGINVDLFGLGNPDALGMDEDYDSCDLENWFLAIQSADGQVMVPSFHRPGILTAADWTLPAFDGSNNVINAPNRSKILRPRQVDNSPLFPYDPSTLDLDTGRLTYDIDNDGDGITDSVWLDLGYPVQRDPNGKIYKPLFAFMVLGLNGRLPLNTVGNIQARAIGDTLYNWPAANGGDNTAYPASSGQVPYPGFYTYQNDSHHHPALTSQVFFDTPLYDHTSHLGFSVNEINPKFALQNAPANLYGSTVNSSLVATANGVFTDVTAPQSFTQYDDAGVSVAVTQLRNLLTGTVPTTLANPYTGNLPASSSGGVASSTQNASNTDLNVVYVNGQPFILPNNMADANDYAPGGVPVVRTNPPVAGRWGEAVAIPSVLPFPSAPLYDPNYPGLVFNNPVRAGKSHYVGGTNDGVDDDFDSLDAYLPSPNQQAKFALSTVLTAGGYDSSNNTYDIPLHPDVLPYSAAPAYAGPVFNRVHPEDVDGFDNAGQLAVATERIRRFVTPQDTSGSGRMVALMTTAAGEQTRPTGDHDYGRGADIRGRVGFFRYFRPSGLPQEVIYPYIDGGTNDRTDATVPSMPHYIPASTNFGSYRYLTNNNNGQRYLMPILLPAGKSAASTLSGGRPVSTPDITNNALHGYQSALTPQLNTALNAYTIATMAAMPYDWDPYANGIPAGYNDIVMDINGASAAPPSSSKGLKIQMISPTINPSTNYLQSAVNTENGPNVGPINDSSTAPANTVVYPVPYGGTYAQYTISDYSGTTLKQGGTDIEFTDLPGGQVVNGYLGGSLNKDEADEMNVYAPGSSDMPFGPTDLEWLYRKHDVDGATLNSRLAQLAPVSFLNPADGLTRRRLFSTDSWELINFSYANDNPVPYAGVLGGYGVHSTDHDFTYNSRFMSQASPSLENMNQVVSLDPTHPQFYQFANPITTEFLANVTLPNHTGNGDSYTTYVPNSSYGPAGTAPIALPAHVDHSRPNTAANPYNLFSTNAFTNAVVDSYTNLVHPYGTTSAAQVTTPSVAHRDRKINLNAPLPISNDPAEPLRQKWCRETYQLLKAILPPAAVDTPEELAALSQYVVNIIDFRDPDCTMTRFVNTDLVVTDALTRSASTSQLATTFDPSWTVSPAGVRFATAGDTFPTPAPSNPRPPHFPYDPSLYSPDTTPTCTFLVQHGMEYNPIAINEAMAYNAEYAANSTDTTPTAYSAMFIELVNTLTESQNNPKATLATSGVQNSSSISLAGWDIVVLPDSYGWGRPDPISGDINPVVMPVYKPTPGGDVSMPPADTDWVNPATDNGWKYLQQTVAQFSIPPDKTPDTPYAVNAFVHAITGTGTPDHYIIGDYRTGTASSPVRFTGDARSIEGANPVARTDSGNNQIDARLPLSFPLPSTPNPSGASTTTGPFNLANNQGTYFWVYLRRPANPFDTDIPNKLHPNKEMVVVDCMRFPVISATGARINSPMMNGQPTVNQKSTNGIYSAQRMQPYRGGHLVAPGTDVSTTTRTAVEGTAITPVPTGANAVTTICPPSPPYAYGYSEQMASSGTGNGAGSLPTGMPGGNPTYAAMTQTIQQSINNTNGVSDTNWAHFPFHDRDFNNVAELLLVPGCPPGLFTKQFVEEPYPGNAFANVARTATAGGTDYTNSFAKAQTGTTIAAPVGTTNPSLVGRQNFNYTTLPSVPTFPYLTDNFYYTAASVAPPIGVQALDAGYTNLTTEIGGWTGAGWHKMLEFFEVPSSANGAIGTADGGDNYDWYRADVKPGLLNLNLIIDEEVFAGLVDDPRLNENLAALFSGTSTIPYVVNQVDGNGYPSYTATGQIIGSHPMFKASGVGTVNVGTNMPTGSVGRGYVYRDPNANNYAAAPPPFQQVHGMKAAFSDFLKLRSGGSGYLFGHGGGDVGMGDWVAGPLAMSNGQPQNPTQPIAADRPYRSLSYPDINYTILRPATLPPAPAYTPPSGTTGYVSPGTRPDLPPALGSLFAYNASAHPTTGGSPYVQLLVGNAAGTTPDVTDPTTNSDLPPMNEATPFQYLMDPGIKNPFLAVQYVNTTAPTSDTAAVRRLAPPYDALTGPAQSPPTPIAAPFPPPIPPTPARRLFQIPDATASSQASYLAAYDSTQAVGKQFAVNEPVSTPMLSTGAPALASFPTAPTPPTLVLDTRYAFGADNSTPVSNPNLNNFLGAGPYVVGTPPTDDNRQHPAYRTELLQKISNLTTVRTHQFATWITIGFFEVVKTGTPELGIPDVLGQEMGIGAGTNVRFRSFFVLDRTKATGFNPYYPGNFRDCVTYRRRIE